MREPTLRALGFLFTMAYAAFIGWVYVRQPQTLEQVTGGLSAAVGVVQVLMRTSVFASMLCALAWQTTSRSRGRTSIERSQKVSGSGAKPSEV